MPAPRHALPTSSDALYRKILLRIMPLLLLCYIVAYIDRVNISLAKLQMLGELGLSDTVFGLGAGIFFIGYFLCEVPSNLILHKVGARFWIARIMVSWGVVAAMLAAIAPIAHLFGPHQEQWVFLALRFLLGAAEAGFFPGLILYFNYWLPPERQGRVFSILMAAQPISFVIGLPLSGWLLGALDGALGLAGWRWMIVIEAAPALVLGLVVARTLVDGPRQASWLTSADVETVVQAVEKRETAQTDLPLGEVARLPVLWAMMAIWFLMVIGVYGINFWLPTLVHASGVQGSLAIGLYSAVPYVGCAVGMVTASAYAERAGCKQAMMVGMSIVGGLALVAAAHWGAGHLLITLLTMTIAMVGAMTASALFWSLPGERLSGRAVAAAVAAINSLGNIGGFAGPSILGFARDRFGSDEIGLATLGLCLVAAGGLVLLVFRNRGGTPSTLTNSLPEGASS
ncbi:MFS transporter [Novosphingobium terrae]|uniref:MFS transporter n=1 Tax=Novosphingobium terrae TaxID=2726189 RepID=UPI00197FB9F3|nr:MFS transporter [Novosphingobium terrae]